MYFNNIIGQSFAKKYIMNSINKDKINHAYLFEGIDGVENYICKGICKAFIKNRTS